MTYTPHFLYCLALRRASRCRTKKHNTAGAECKSAPAVSVLTVWLFEIRVEQDERGPVFAVGVALLA